MPEIVYRIATPRDRNVIADYFLMASGGFLEFLLEKLILGFSPKQLLAQAISSPDGLRSHKNCYVAECDGKIIGAMNIFPVDALQEEDLSLFHGERLAYISDFNEVQDWGSMLLSSIAVNADYQNQGIGTQLLNRAIEHTHHNGCDRISLHIWEDNAIAQNFFITRGFQAIGGADIPPHPRLARSGGTILMNRIVMGERALLNT
jgi:GNAT superfamily N-acetyltransferase